MRRTLTLALAAALAAGAALAQPPDTGTDVAPLTVTPGPRAPIPKVGQGAPEFSIRELQGFEEAGRRCVGIGNRFDLNQRAKILASKLDSIALAAERHDGRIVMDVLADEYDLGGWNAVLIIVAVEAIKATEAAEKARRSGDAETMAQAEIARQATIRRLVVVRSILVEVRSHYSDVAFGRADLFEPNRSRRAAAVEINSPAAYADLGLTKVTVREVFEGNGQKALLVTGEIHNTRAKPIAVPPLRLVSFDSQGFPLNAVTALSETRRGRIAPGQSAAFSYRLKPAPRNAVQVVVTFGSLLPKEFLLRTPIGCEAPEGS